MKENIFPSVLSQLLTHSYKHLNSILSPTNHADFHVYFST